MNVLATAPVVLPPLPGMPGAGPSMASAFEWSKGGSSSQIRTPLLRSGITWARVVRLHGLKEVNDLQRTCQVERSHRAQVLDGQVKVWGALNATERS